MDLKRDAGGSALRYARRLRLSLRHVAFNSPRWAANRRRLIVLGDSHMQTVVSYVAPRLNAFFDVTPVSGCTAHGMTNPNSITDARGIFQRRIDRALPGQTVVFGLGEVDCGFVIWILAEKYGLPAELQLAETVGNYLAFIDQQQDAGLDVWVLSAPLPTIVDGQDWGEVASWRQQVRATQAERTKLTLLFNELVQQGCGERGVEFLDVTSAQLDPATGLVRDGWRHPNPLNHHLDDDVWGELLVHALMEASWRQRARPTACNYPPIERVPGSRRVDLATLDLYRSAG